MYNYTQFYIIIAQGIFMKKTLYLIISLLFLSCTNDNYHYFFEKAPVYQFDKSVYLRPTNSNKTEMIGDVDQIPFSLNYIEMPFDLVIALDEKEFSMIEIINIPGNQNTVWFTLESKVNG